MTRYGRHDMKADHLAIPLLALLLAGTLPEPVAAQDPAVSHDAERRVDQLMADYGADTPGGACCPPPLRPPMAGAARRTR